MFEGTLVAIYLAEDKVLPLKQHDTARAIPGAGLEGDRYALQKGTFTKPGNPNREVTLIESEALAGAAQDYGLSLEPGEARRNLVTRGVPLNHLVGLEFTVGEVTLRGLKLCEPCDHLERLTKPGVEKALKHRGGLRAQVIVGGTLRAGDPIRPAGATKPDQGL